MIRRILLTALLTALLAIMAACHEDDLVFHLIEGPTPPIMEVGLAEPEPMPDPPCEVIKGNLSRDGRKLYHEPGMSNYDQVKIDEAAGERFFCSVAEAEAAGWTRAGN